MIRKTITCDVCDKTIDVQQVDQDPTEQRRWRGLSILFDHMWTKWGMSGKPQHACSAKCARVLLSKAIESLDSDP